MRLNSQFPIILMYCHNIALSALSNLAPRERKEMDQNLKNNLISIYRRYGFTLARDHNDYLVFTLKTGYFDNAEIIKLNPELNVDAVFKEFTGVGFACKAQNVKDPKTTEEDLFKGFFSVDATRHRLSDDYVRFAKSLVSPYGDNAKYEYIRAPYNINGKEGQNTVPEEVVNLMGEGNPILFLIEAAAGFGKTCTAQEIVNLLTEGSNYLPLYAELSRNRQARIFRYILLDEIDRTFPLLNSNLVQTEIKNGRIATILDGFDELLRKHEDSGDFQNKEPMLETVSELLTGKAKIIITTRRTVLFDGDEFHQWLDQHAEDFSVVRIRIQEPRIGDWLSHTRLDALRHVGLDIDAMANPVLLSYLRCIDDTSFSQIVANPETIVQSYFEYMLDRERERQDLRMTVDVQSHVLRGIAADMIQNGYTAEQRDYVVKHFLEKNIPEIDTARNQYPASDRPSREEIANKLASHALLDRSQLESTKIGFVNEFSLGNYVAENIIRDSDWLNDDMRFIDPAVRSFAPRTQTSRKTLYDGLANSLPFLDVGARADISAELISSLPENLSHESIEGLELTGIDIGAPRIDSFQFNEVIFKKCRFIKPGLNDVTFLNCRFFDCTVEEDSTKQVYVLGGVAIPEITEQLATIQSKDNETSLPDRELQVSQELLRRLWPIGDSFSQKPSRPIFKPLKSLCQPTGDFNSKELYDGLSRLLRSGVLTELHRASLITLNLDSLSDAQRLLTGGA